MAQKVGKPRLERGKVLPPQLVLLQSAVHFERAHGGDHHARRRRKTGEAALDVEELLRAEVGAEARLRDDVIPHFERRFGRHDGVAPVRDVGKRPAVHEGGRPLERLHEVGLQGVFQQRAHGALRLQIARRDGLFFMVIRDDDAGKARL